MDAIAPDPATALRPLGATVLGPGVGYRVWAPDHARVRVLVTPAGGGGDYGDGARVVELTRDAEGYFEGVDDAGRAGDRYRYLLGDEEDAAKALPDPASRAQPEGVFGASEVVEPGAYVWRGTRWQRPPLRGRVIYEIHVGTFTTEGTFLAAIERLPHLVDIGVNTLQLMPLAEFPGARGWGYDGVFLFAPFHGYGTPEELRMLVDAAHGLGLAVVLDVVYNHLGPVGNVLPTFAASYLHPERANPWGRGLNFDGAHSAPVREFFLQNAAAWLDEYRFDGLRLDSIHSIVDESPTHLLAELAEVARARGAFLIGEDERNLARVVTPLEQNGLGLDAVWADDFHHCVRVALTHQRESHFGSFTGAAGELADILAHGWRYRGGHYPHWRRKRGTACAHLPPEAFVWCIGNHDQVGNRPLGDRLHQVASPAAYRAASLLLCLAPGTPMFFMGQEWGASTPFAFFSDHPGEVGAKMAEARLAEFASYGVELDEETRAAMPDPQAGQTFAACKLLWDERATNGKAALLALHRDALRLRAAEAVFQNPPRGRWRAWAPTFEVVALRWADAKGDWLLLVSLWPGFDAHLPVEGELAPPERHHWALRIDSNSIFYGAAPDARPAVCQGGEFRLPAPGAVLFRATRVFAQES